MYGSTEWSYVNGNPGLHINGDFGYASFTMSQEAIEFKMVYNSLTTGDVISEIGSRFIGLFGIFYFLLSSYESFSFDKSSIKAFYFSDNEDRVTRNSGEQSRNDMMNRLRSEMYL